MTPFGLGLLRQTAALVHTVPGLVATVVHESRPLVDVSWQGTRTHPAIRWLPPCGFRAVVAQALSSQRAGRDVALLGLPPGGDPTVRTRALAPATAHPFGLVSAIVGGRAVWAHATVAPPATVASVVEQVSSARSLPAAGPPCVDLLHDDDLDVTLVVVERSWPGLRRRDPADAGRSPARGHVHRRARRRARTARAGGGRPRPGTIATDVVVSGVGTSCSAAAVDDARGALGALPAGHRFWVRRVDEGPDASAEVLDALRAAGLVAGIHGRVVSVGSDGEVTIACAGRVSELPRAAAMRVSVVAGSIDDLTH